MIPLSILDLVTVNQGQTVRDALHRSLELAQHAERWGYQRFWVAEHHNMPNIASAATSVVIGYLAAGTTSIRIGAGGIMLPNHAPIMIAEQFGTLESLYPGRIDLGVGRAPGTDVNTTRALRRDPQRADLFPAEVVELQSFLAPLQAGQKIQAIPGVGLNIPLWILGSSLFGAKLAATLGLPYSFAAHFAPDYLPQALAVYRREFKPSAQLSQPYVMLCINAVAADSDIEAKHLFTTMQQSFTNLIRGRRDLTLPPIDNMDNYWAPLEKQQVSQMLNYSIVGSAETVKSGLQSLIAETSADELMIVSNIYAAQARLRSYEIISKIAKLL